MKFDVTTIGDCQLDHFVRLGSYKVLPAGKTGEAKLLLDFSQKIPISEFKLFYGGNALNTAVSFSRLGLSAAIRAYVGADLEGQAIVRHIKRNGINPSFLVSDTDIETDKSVVIVTGGERTILTYHDKKNYSFPKNLKTAWVYLTSLGDGYERMYQGVKKFVAGGNAKLAFNPGTRQLKQSLSAVRRMLKYCDLFFVNAEEARTISGQKSSDILKLLSKLNSLGAKKTVVTDGIKGAYCFDGKDRWRISSFPARRVDATGAGDAFASAVTAAIIYGQPIAEAMRWGSINAASEIAQIGVQNGLLGKTSLSRILQKYKAFQARKF